LSDLVLSSVVLAIILAGASVGAFLRSKLPALPDDTRDVLKLGVGLVGTLAALVLGLLIASAKTSFDSQSANIRQITSDVALLDHILTEYGPQARTARDLIRRATGSLVERMWGDESSAVAVGAPAAGEAAYTAIEALAPQSDAQRSLQARAVQISTDLSEKRLLLLAQADNSIPKPFLAGLVLWLTIIFGTFGLFAKPNQTLIAGLFVFALSASVAIFLIVDLSQPFNGLMQVSSAPLRTVLAPLPP
jgi:hypothetical protein